MPKQLVILLIDEDKGMVDLLTTLLSRSNCQILATSDGAEALRLVREKAPDVILLDLLKPSHKGINLCKSIRRLSNSPILFFSVNDSPEVIAAALDAGGDDFLVKPISSSMLVARLNKVLRRTSPLKIPALTDP